MGETAEAQAESVTLAIRYTEPLGEPVYLWVMPYDAALDTLLRCAGANAAAWIPPEAVPSFALRDSVTYLTVPRWSETMVYAVGWRGTHPLMGREYPAPLPQLTAGRVGGSPQVPLSWRGSTTAGDTISVELRFNGFENWKPPCSIEGGCE